ncbi:MAG: purine-nucleoside phosphorylase [Deltaproteobacteria bacterium]|nr:purine-nucleoside phosphorylase [Deltaproteobacteria bacterium]
MQKFKQQVLEAVRTVEAMSPVTPQIGFLAGTGLGDTLKAMEDAVSLDYDEIPHFPASTVSGHQGRLVIGHVKGKAVIAMQGRFHYYEGYTMAQISLPIRTMQLLGVKTLIVTNASGGINPLFCTGDIMLIADHINLTGNNPLIGPNIDEWGPRFPEMIRVYDPSLMALAEQAALRRGIGLRKGIYVGLAGPSLETPAEIRFLKTIGADAVGLSTIPEVITAVHGGMAILGLSVITNMNLPDAPAPCQIEDVIATAETAAPKVRAIVEGVLEGLPGS